MAGVADAVDAIRMVGFEVRGRGLRARLIIIVERMLILALDTTTRTGSAALLRDEELLLEEGSDPDRPPAARLPADLMGLLARTDVSLDDIDVFAVATGPGSFTGLRIGIATMQGLAFAKGRPLVGISALDALASVAAAHAGEMGVKASAIVTWVDAWRGEVYAAVHGATADVQQPIVAAPATLLDDYEVRFGDRLSTEGLIFIGDGADTYRRLLRDRLGPAAILSHPTVPLLAAAVARLGRAMALRRDLPPPHAIRPLYVRRPDAELARNRR
jgi:tRNA threonylcarbamoyladenosine biosynthesis protein TsaB